MSQILKHSFEAVSLLTTDNGMLEVTMIPAKNQPDWIIPSSLILSVDDHQERIGTYSWQQQQLAVFHLQPYEQVFDKIIVLEGNTAEHRIALQTIGELRQVQVRISDVRDMELPQNYQQMTTTDVNADTSPEHVRENELMTYLFQTVMIDDTSYLIPDLDKIAHQLVNSKDYLG